MTMNVLEYPELDDIRAESHRRRVQAAEHRARILRLAVWAEQYKLFNVRAASRLGV